MLWSLIAIVLIKYVFILLRLDNRGEGGTLSFMALVQRALGQAHGVPVPDGRSAALASSTATPC